MLEGNWEKRGRAKLEVLHKAQISNDMNYCAPDWKMENDPRYFLHLLPPSSNVGQEDNLIELLWKNGHVILHNQNSCISPATIAESKQAQKTENASICGGSLGSSMNLVQVDETASWFPNPLDDSVENDFHDFFCGMRTPEPNVIDKETMGEICVKLCPTKDTNVCAMQSSLHPQDRKDEMRPAISDFGGVASGSDTTVRMGESSSMMTNESSICRSNQYQNNSSNVSVVENSLLGVALNNPQKMTFDPIISSSSGGSGSSLGKMGQKIMVNYDHKRKGRDAESDCQNTEQASPEPNKHAQKTAPLRRSRAAEVHNLSERRRRDKINEKMKALQDLIPHCNKPDKASMLDEAIEYLKSLQLQVQIMWMGGGMAPMFFPGLQQYMPHLVNGTGHSPSHSIPNPVQLPGARLYNQFMPPISTPNRPLVCSSSPGISPINFPTQMPSVPLPGPFPHYFGFPHMHMPAQVMDFYTYGSQVMQQNQTAAAVASNHMPPLGTCSETFRVARHGKA